MKKIFPFRGILYNPDKIRTMADVVSPPYDIITTEMQDRLCEKSPYNFCRLDLPREEGEERYHLAKKLYEKWLGESILIQDKKPAIYLYHHTYRLPDGVLKTRKGFFAARRVEDFSQGSIKPHEKTLSAPKEDRFQLTQAVQANLSPVFSLYADPDFTIEEKCLRASHTTPFLDFVTEDHQRHQLWRMTDAEVHAFIDSRLSGKPVFIADGHHRYETAVNWRSFAGQSHGKLSENSAADFVLMYFSNSNDQGLSILPIHRVIHGVTGFDAGVFLNKISSLFQIEDVRPDDVSLNVQRLAGLGKEHHPFWLILPSIGKSCLLRLGRREWQNHHLAQGLSKNLAQLDVTVLHDLVFKSILGLTDESQAREQNITYVKSAERALACVREQKSQAVFLLNPVRIEEVQAVALSAERMPQKSTYFYPKVMSGLVVHSVRADDIDG